MQAMKVTCCTAARLAVMTRRRCTGRQRPEQRAQEQDAVVHGQIRSGSQSIGELVPGGDADVGEAAARRWPWPSRPRWVGVVAVGPGEVGHAGDPDRQGGVGAHLESLGDAQIGKSSGGAGVKSAAARRCR